MASFARLMMNHMTRASIARQNVQRVAHTPTAAPSVTCLQFHRAAPALPISVEPSPANLALLALITGNAKLSAVHDKYVSEPERS